MTTIAYRKGIIAADSGVWLGETLICKMRKLYRLSDGSVAGIAGTVGDAIKLVKCLNEGVDNKEKLGEDVEVMVVKPDGRVTCYSGSTLNAIKPYRCEYMAIGSGTPFALAAFFNKASAVQAVKTAMEFDGKTRGPITTMKVNGG